MFTKHTCSTDTRSWSTAPPTPQPDASSPPSEASPTGWPLAVRRPGTYRSRSSSESVPHQTPLRSSAAGPAISPKCSRASAKLSVSTPDMHKHTHRMMQPEQHIVGRPKRVCEITRTQRLVQATPRPKTTHPPIIK
jgi:hypothetical protein